MITLKEHLINKEHNNVKQIIESNIIAENMICEAFKSTLLGKLANLMYDVEKNAGRSTKRTFLSIFGPRREHTRYGEGKQINGVRWSEITDDQIQKVEGDDKAVVKLIKQVYTSKKRGDFILCEPGTQDIKYFIKCFGYNDKNTKRTVYSIDQNKGVNAESKQAYRWSSRDYNIQEVLDLIADYDVYFIEITDDMIKDYGDLTLDRKNAKKNVINYDEESMKELIKKNRMRLKSLAKELKAKKLSTQSENLFDEITKLNEEIVSIYREVIANPNLIDKVYDVSRLIGYMPNIYDYYMRYIQYDNMNKKQKEELGRDRDGYFAGEAQDSIVKCQNYLNELKERIENVKQEIKK